MGKTEVKGGAASGRLVLKWKMVPPPRLDGDPGQGGQSWSPGGWDPQRTEWVGAGAGLGSVTHLKPVRQSFHFCFIGEAKRPRGVRNLTKSAGKEAVGGARGVS